jgi:TfoX/Sxy family transcriptional regulator of competence genes
LAEALLETLEEILSKARRDVTPRLTAGCVSTIPFSRMAYDEQLAERVRRGFGQRNVRFEEKRMMGGLCFLVDSKMCVGVEKNRLMARIAPEVYDYALRRKGCAPMDFTGRPMRGFVFVNPEGLVADGELEQWLKLALDFNPSAKASKKASAKRKLAKRS